MPYLNALEVSFSRQALYKTTFTLLRDFYFTLLYFLLVRRLRFARLILRRIIGSLFAITHTVISRGVARNSFWVGIIFLLHNTTVLYTSSRTTSAAISAQNNFQGLILGGYIYRYTPIATPLQLTTPELLAVCHVGLGFVRKILVFVRGNSRMFE